MRKLLNLFVVAVLVSTSFTMISGLPQASASPVLSQSSNGDPTAYVNSTVSYHNRVTSQETSSTNTVNMNQVKNTTYETETVNLPNNYWATNSAKTEGWFNVTNMTGDYVYAGSTVHLRTASILGTSKFNTYYYVSLGWMNVSITIETPSSSYYTYTFSYDYKYLSAYYTTAYNDVYWHANYSANLTVSVSGKITAVNITQTAYPGYPWNVGTPRGLVSDNSNDTQLTDYGTSASSLVSSVYNYFAQGWHFNSVSSSFSSQVPTNSANIISFSIYWSAQYSSSATYNSNRYTTSPITGAVGVYSIAFSNIQLFAPNYTISYYETFNYYTYPLETQTNSTSFSYSIVQSSVGVYFNASFSFSFKIVSSSLYANSTYPISWDINVSHLQNLYYSAPYNSFSYSISYSNYSKTTLGTSTSQYWDFISYTNWTNGNGASLTWMVSTHEVVNYYPSITYVTAKWTGVGSTEELIVNASNTFKNESMQITNINWGDGSPANSSAVETASKGYYNFTFTHSYSSIGTFSISFQVVNMVNTPESLSHSGSTSITLSLTITTAPSDAQAIPTDSYLYFNWTSQNIGIQKVVGSINGIQALSNTYNNLTSGSVSYYQTQTAQFTMTWTYYAGSYESSTSVIYVIKNTVPVVGKWVIVNYTLGTGSTAIKESVPYFYTQTIPYNATWSYFEWQIALPNNAVNITVKGNPMWKDPMISVPADYNTTTATFKLLENFTMFQITWIAENPTYNALIVIQYYPETALFGQFGVTLPFSAFYTYLNGQQIYSPTQTVNLGETIIINTTTIYHTLLSSYKVTVTQQTQFIEIPLNILPLTIENLNSSYVIGMQIEANSIVQTAQYIMPLQSVTFYVPAGTYNFTFNYIKFNTYTVVQSLNVPITVSSVSYYIISGITLSQISLSLQATQNNITNLVENVNITLTNANDKINNEVINLNLSLANVNSTIINQIDTLETQVKNYNSTVYNQLLSVIADIKNTNSTILAQVNKVLTNITNLNSTVLKQTNTILTDISNLNSTVKSEFIRVLTNITNLNTSLKTQVINILNNISNMNATVKKEILNVTTQLANDNSTIIKQILNSINDIENTNSSISKQLINVLSQISNTNSTLYKQIVRLSLNLTNTNSTIYRQLLVENLTVNNIQSKVLQIYNDINIIENNIMSDINSTSLNVTTRILTIKALLLASMNSTIQYKITPGTAYSNASNSSYTDIPLYITTLNGSPLNLSMTESIARNLSINYISPGQELPLDFTIIKIQAGVITIQVSLDKLEKQYISSGTADIAFTAPVKTETNTNIAGGVATGPSIGMIDIVSTAQVVGWILYLFTPIVAGISIYSLLFLGTLIYLTYALFNIPKKSRAKSFRIFMSLSLIMTLVLLYAIYVGGYL